MISMLIVSDIWLYYVIVSGVENQNSNRSNVMSCVVYQSGVCDFFSNFSNQQFFFYTITCIKKKSYTPNYQFQLVKYVDSKDSAAYSNRYHFNKTMNDYNTRHVCTNYFSPKTFYCKIRPHIIKFDHIQRSSCKTFVNYKSKLKYSVKKIHHTTAYCDQKIFLLKLDNNKRWNCTTSSTYSSNQYEKTTPLRRLL